MNFYLIGVDYQSAPLEIREEISLRRKEISAFWHYRRPEKVAILSTCNRIEIYGLVEDSNAISNEIADFKQNFKGLFENAYIKLGKAEIFEHLLLLACGLKSQLVGELQILQQLSAWPDNRLFPGELSQLLKQILPLAEDIRKQSGLNREEVNIANIIFGDLKKRIVAEKKMELVIVGTGKIAQLIAQYRSENMQLHFISHKRHLKAKILAEQTGGAVHQITDLPDLLLTVDALISATSSPHYILLGKHFPAAINKRQQPVYIYDLAMPRDIEPNVRNLAGVHLQDANDLSKLFNQDNQRRSQEINLAEYLAKETINRLSHGQDHKSRHTAQQVGRKTI